MVEVINSTISMRSLRKMHKEQLFDDNMNLAYSYVHKSGIRIPGYTQEDLFQTALIGLWKACRTFDSQKGIKFSTYATNCIKNELLMALRKYKKDQNILSLDAILGTKTLRYETFEDDVITQLKLQAMELTREEKVILWLKEYLTEFEIAALCNIPAWKLRRAMNKIRRNQEKTE